jgi:uncharacterized protein (DUF2336 family)
MGFRGQVVGLTARDFSDTRRLARLASDPTRTNREDIYLAVASLYRNQSDTLSPQERELMRDILQRLTHDVEMAVRIALAERLADDASAPLDLILLLVDDRIEVARPIILRSRRLTDRELLGFIAGADAARQTVCAERPQISEPVTAVLAKSDAEPVLVALVRNATARIAPATFEALVEKSRRLPSIQEPLARREDLPSPLANRMCGWVSEALKSYLVESGRLQPESTAKVEAATQAVAKEPAAGQIEASSNAVKLVDKLATAGQLRAGFLLRVLQQGQFDLFDLAFSKLVDLPVAEFRRMFYLGGPRFVALSCRAVGIDKSVFSTVFNLSQSAQKAPPPLTPDERADVEHAFTSFSRSEALSRLHTKMPA